MSCALTIDAVNDRSKTVTRRHADTWVTLAPGDRLTLVEQGQGLAAGATQVILADVVVTSVELVELDDIDQADVAREGFADWTPERFTAFWRESHGVEASQSVIVRRIEWAYDTSTSSTTDRS